MRPEEYKSLPKEKFVLVNENKKLHDKELVTKPVGYFKDAMIRFSKNKGSIFGAIVIGILVLYAIIAPIISPYTVAYKDDYFRFSLPKVFDSEKIDFLDGASNKTANEATLVYFYSMGLETGHNALKRQEFKKKDNGMYTYRLDSYQKVGAVFKSLTRSEYLELQQYQDDNNVQIIYPITDTDLRPAASQDKKDANFWYKTRLNGSITAPDEYAINEDGTITLQNIYLPYSTPFMNSDDSIKNAAKIVFETKDIGYSIKLYQPVFENATVKTYEDIGYLQLKAEDNNSVAFLTNDLEDASIFTLDTVHNALVSEIDGHDDLTLDGTYFMGIGSTTGSKVMIMPTSELTTDNYIPFTAYDGEGAAITSITTGDQYYLAANRSSVVTTSYYINRIDSSTKGFKTTTSLASSLSLTLKQISGVDYAIMFKNAKFDNYIVVNDNAGVIEVTGSSNFANASAFNFDSVKGALYTVVGGKNLYFTLDLTDADNPSISLKEASAVDNTKTFFLNLFVKDNDVYVPATAIADGDSIRMTHSETKTIDRHFYIDGGFKGDNYSSRMRVEGEGNYLYSYAYQKAGNSFEVRVNYFEYYRYYHKHILKDRISSPYFIFGTTSNGQDIFTCLASGARFSFILAIVVASVNFLVGTIYGAIEGYYGGKTDLIMERIVEILSAVPFMIVITLLKYHMGSTSQVVILFIAYFLTGWIGMSGTVRMQFYRFKNQEYVLASRTLGAKDLRIMFKHIFPNSLGTIITSSVLVIPGMIFSETSLSYLGIINLNSGNLTSVGTLLAGGQPYLVTYPHIILFPSIFISLLMLCFNLFGNGLRDAFNPSLRGTED